MEKLTIKESGRYANFLDKTLSSLINLTRGGIDASLFETTEIHKKSEAYKEAIDEEIKVEYENRVELKVDELTNIINTIVAEKSLLADKIAEAKKDLKIELDESTLNLDAAIETAKLYRKVSQEYMSKLEGLKDKKTKQSERGYAFNVEGNQTAYYYNVETTTKILFDRKDIVAANKDYKAKADKLSEKIEQAMSLAIVEIEPKFNYLDTLEEVVEKF